MKKLRVLFVTNELSPFTGNDDEARQCRLLARGLADLGLAVTVIVPGGALDDPGEHGLARRLSPFRLPDGSAELTLHEGRLPDGRAEVIVVETPPGDPDVFCRAVLALVERPGHFPHVVLAGHGAEGVVNALAGDGARAEQAPALVFVGGRLAEVSTDSHALRTALGHCDRVVVSSPQWVESLRREPGTSPVERLLAPIGGKLRGVNPGVDSLEWNPRRDRFLSSDFCASPTEHKAAYKEELQRELGLKIQPDVPLVALVGPLDPLVLPYTASSELAQRELQLVVLADRLRDDKCLRSLTRLANQNSLQISLQTPDDPAQAEALQHRLLAAADLQLFAHRSSPTALCPLYSMHYGVVPIAPGEGSFADLLVEFDSTTRTGSGFLFTPEKGDTLLRAIDRGLQAYRRPESWLAARERALTMDLSWATTAQRYGHLFLEVLRETGRLAA